MAEHEMTDEEWEAFKEGAGITAPGTGQTEGPTIHDRALAMVQALLPYVRRQDGTYGPCNGCDVEARIDDMLVAIDDKSKFYPFGKLNPDDPIDQAIVKAFNKTTED